MEKLKLREAIVVEGRYDKNTLSQVVDTLILETNGFGIFKNREQMELLRQVAAIRGLIVLTDGDGAGFVIRNRLISSIPGNQLKHAYIPDIFGKEKRKIEESKEGKLGVEGMSPEILRDILLRAGGTTISENYQNKTEITSSDFVRWGLSGGDNSSDARKKLLSTLNLPENMSKKALLRLINSCYSREEVEIAMKGSG